MKAVVLVFVLVLTVGVPGLALSQDFDGVWVTPDPSTLLMIRENAGAVLVLNMQLSFYTSDNNVAYEAYTGTRNGDTIHVFDVNGFSVVDAEFTAVLTSPTSATVTVNRCTPKIQGVSCVFPPSVTFQIFKVF